MNIHHSTYPGHHVMAEPMTDPLWIHTPFSERGLTSGSGPP
jgi:hypothetical protein